MSQTDPELQCKYPENYTVSGKNGPPKENAVKCTVYNTIK